MTGQDKEIIQDDKEVLLTFLKQTREGKYAKIGKITLNLLRVKEETEEIYYEDEYYYYGVR